MANIIHTEVVTQDLEQLHEAVGRLEEAARDYGLARSGRKLVPVVRLFDFSLRLNLLEETLSDGSSVLNLQVRVLFP